MGRSCTAAATPNAVEERAVRATRMPRYPQLRKR
jgi:hypothetical protein